MREKEKKIKKAKRKIWVIFKNPNFQVQLKTQEIMKPTATNHILIVNSAQLYQA